MILQINRTIFLITASSRGQLYDQATSPFHTKHWFSSWCGLLFPTIQFNAYITLFHTKHSFINSIFKSMDCSMNKLHALFRQALVQLMVWISTFNQFNAYKISFGTQYITLTTKLHAFFILGTRIGFTPGVNCYHCYLQLCTGASWVVGNPHQLKKLI